jgi:hypothetical protein
MEAAVASITKRFAACFATGAPMIGSSSFISDNGRFSRHQVLLKTLLVKEQFIPAGLTGKVPRGFGRIP